MSIERTHFFGPLCINRTITNISGEKYLIQAKILIWEIKKEKLGIYYISAVFTQHIKLIAFSQLVTFGYRPASWSSGQGL